MDVFKEILRKYLVESGISQGKLASIMGVSQQSISDFLNKEGNPHKATKAKYFKNLEGFKEFYKQSTEKRVVGIMSVDEMLSSEDHINWNAMVREPDAHWYGVPNTMMVPMISHRAQAGFLSGWADDTATLDDFPKIPWEVDREYKGKYVCFEVTGDSMDDGSREALLDGDVILCREVMQQHWKNRLHINQWDFVIAHKEKGIVVKRIIEHEVETGRLVLHSLNDLYDDYEVYLRDCIAIFNVVDVKRSRRR